jgi:hypothetical protein
MIVSNFSPEPSELSDEMDETPSRTNPYMTHQFGYPPTYGNRS